MDYSGAYDLSKASLNMTTDFEINVLYSGAFVATLPIIPISLWMMLHGRDWSAGFGMSVLIVVASWLRWLSIVYESYFL